MGLWAFGPLGAFEALGTSWAFLGLGLWGLERCPNNEVVMQVVQYAQVSFITFDIVPKLIT